MPTIAQRLNRAKSLPFPKRQGPVWKGPEADGITCSLLSKFLVCRERFRLLVVEGLKQRERFSHRLEYGQMWHLCEEALAAREDWQDKLADYAVGLLKRFPMSINEIDKWYGACQAQFPVYVEYWSKHPDVRDRVPMFQEFAFRVPYTLPSGRTVLLRGKFDSVDLIGKGKEVAIYLQENKTKSNPDERQLKRQLTFDLQTMVYLIALQEMQKMPGLDPKMARYFNHPVKGVRYNVIRRPLSGGKGTIVPHKEKRTKKKIVPAESQEHFFGRLSAIIRADPGSFFQRYKVEVWPQDVERFKRECLHPILEQLCDWWDWISKDRDPFTGHCDSGHGCHFRMPYGCYSPLLDSRAGETELDEYLANGSEAGLEHTSNLFPELT